MCDICGQTLCKSRCPNTEYKIVGKCKWCDDPIYENEERVEINDDLYHVECLSYLDFKDVLKLLDIEVEG